MSASRSLYRLLLRLCPGDLTAEFGGEMEALCMTELARARGIGKAGVWWRAMVDVVRHASAPATTGGIDIERRPRTWSTGGVLMLVAVLAVTVPALKAMRVDPVTALRQ